MHLIWSSSEEFWPDASRPDMPRERIDKKSLFRRHGHPAAGTDLKGRFHGGNVAESGWRCQIRLQTGFERNQGAGKMAGRQ